VGGGGRGAVGGRDGDDVVGRGGDKGGHCIGRQPTGVESLSRVRWAEGGRRKLLEEMSALL